MASTIGLRIYRLAVYDQANKTYHTNASIDIQKVLMSAINSLITDYSDMNTESDIERNWYFQEDANTNSNECIIFGHLQYGTYGFQSRLIDTKTQKENYIRKTTDSEMIPLFYYFWIPNNSDHGYVAFQSFQGRSCIEIVTKKLKAIFDRQTQKCRLDIIKIMPYDEKNSLLKNHEVKRLRLKRLEVPKDIADKYAVNSKLQEIDFEISLNAKRKGSLGTVKNILDKIKDKKQNSIIEFNGINFNSAIAEVRIGNKVRSVGIFGYNENTGIIDITDTVEKDLDGHPNAKSIQNETKEILNELNNIYNGRENED